MEIRLKTVMHSSKGDLIRISSLRVQQYSSENFSKFSSFLEVNRCAPLINRMTNNGFLYFKGGELGYIGVIISKTMTP